MDGHGHGMGFSNGNEDKQMGVVFLGFNNCTRMEHNWISKYRAAATATTTTKATATSSSEHGGGSHQPKHGILEQAAQDDLIPSAFEADWRCNLFVESKR